MPGSFRIFRIAGIDIEVNVSWLVILVLLTVSLALFWFPQTLKGQTATVYWALGFIASLLLFVSVLLHELAHSLVARARGLSVSSITLFIFGGVSNLQQEPQSPGMEFQIAVVGPVTSLVIGAASYYAARFVGASQPLVAATLGYLGIANILLGIFNLIPGFPLDGGRVLRSIIWGVTGSLQRATRWAARAGQLVAYLFILGGVWLFFSGDFVDGIWIGFIGWFLLQAAISANSQVALEAVLKGVTVGQLMTQPTQTTRANASVQDVVDCCLLPDGARSIPVVREGELVGLITLADVRRVPRDQWANTPVGYVMIPLERLHVVRPEQLLNEVLPLMAANDVNQLLVVDSSGRLLGMLTRDAVVRYIEVRRGLGLDDPRRGGRTPTGQQPPTDLPAAS